MKNEKKIAHASLVSLIGNAFLAVSKIIIGLLSGSLAVVADGIDSTGDILSSAIALYSAKLMSKPPTKKYPYGFAKADTISAKTLSFIMLFAGLQLGIATVKKIMDGTTAGVPGMAAIFVTVVSIFAKWLLAWYQLKISKKTKSTMLRANAKNMQGDILISLGVLIGLFFTMHYNNPLIDNIIALLVSAWIIKTGLGIFFETSRDLMDGIRDESIYNDIFGAIDSVEGVYNPHRVRTRKIGPRIMVAIDIEVKGDIPLKEAHSLAHKVEQTIKEKIDDVFDVNIHVEPLGDETREQPLGFSRENIRDG